ncbi:hypothetical protein X777_05378 [Ooceraea biroi]|uniref:Uncharacterized protein n=1 Tax=Ooceraea biroi TaxID=2015173 RepID=A0A026WFI5_OOCBI|nr:hypothetical protein X777_05378 [Ooceraea biroi]
MSTLRPSCGGYHLDDAENYQLDEGLHADASRLEDRHAVEYHGVNAAKLLGEHQPVGHRHRLQHRLVQEDRDVQLYQLALLRLLLFSPVS